MAKISVYYQVFNNKSATEKVLETFRRNNPDNFIYLVNDGGCSKPVNSGFIDTFANLANKHNCFYTHSSFNCGYHTHDNPKVVKYREGKRAKDGSTHCYGYDSKEAGEYLSRVYSCCLHSPEDTTHILFLEDDVYVNVNINSQLWIDNFDLTHPHFNNKIPKELFSYMESENMKISSNLDSFGVCGGNVIFKDLFVSNYIKFGGKFIKKYDEIYQKMGNIGWNDSLVSVFMGLFCSCRVGENVIYSEHDRNAGIFHDRGHRIG